MTVNGVQTLYVADDQGGGVGGVFKYTLSGTTWSKVGSTQRVLRPCRTGERGPPVIAAWRATSREATVTLMASSGMAAGGQDELVVIVDTGTGTPSQTMIRRLR